MIRIHSENTSASLVQVAHDIAGELIRNGYMQGNDRLEKNRTCLHEAILECHVCGGLECLLGGVYRMIGSVVQDSLDADYRISGHRACGHGISDTLLNSREEVLRDSAADNDLLEYISFVKVSGRLESHLDMTVLAVSAGLLLILGINVAVLADRLLERDCRLAQFSVDLILGLQLADDDIQVLIAHAVQKSLMISCVIDGLHGQVFLADLRKSLCDLVEVTLVLRFVSLIGIRRGDVELRKENGSCLGRQSISGGSVKLRDGSDITGLQFRDLLGLAAAHDIELACAELVLGLGVIQSIIRFQAAAGNLDQGVLTDERVNDRLPDKCALRSIRLVINVDVLVALGILAADRALCRRREVTDNIVKKDVDTLKIRGGTDHYRAHIALADILLQSSEHLFLGELFAAEVLVHELFAGLSDRLEHGITARCDIIFHVSRLIDLILLLFVNILVGLLGYDVHIADKLLVLADRKIQRSDLGSVELCKSIDYLDRGSVLHIHVGDIEHSGKAVLLAQIPCLLRSDFNAALAVNNDDRRVSSCCSFFSLADEIEISGSVQHVDLHILADHGNDRGADRELSVLFFFIKVTDRIAVSYISKSGSNA